VKLYLRTFGCRANQYDSEAVRAMVVASGGTIVDSPGNADVAVFNSCAVTADAEADLRQAVRRAARSNPGLRSIVMGCASALPGRDGAFSLAALPSVQTLVAGADLDAVGEALQLESLPASARTRHQSGARALLRIQDGCDEHCTFCATTIARGASRSRPPADLVAEATRLAEHHAEIVITGVHIGRYGEDCGGSLGALLDRLVRDVPHVRFRLSSVESTEVDDRLAELLVGTPGRVAPHLHAPLQSASDRLLRRMGRHWYTAASYGAGLERLVRSAPVFALGADLITGFPGETDADHTATLSFVTSLPFTSLHVFPYSPRPGTAAERLPDRVSPERARARAAELRALGEAKQAAHRAARTGGLADVVVVGRGTSGERDGVTEDYLSVKAPWPQSDGPLRFAARLVATEQGVVAEPRPTTEC
jgi:threonylcarbamoyladenosine tRNA methylthiotransferase MtaB